MLLGRYDEKVDIWSTGVITYVMLSGTHPFSGKSAEEVLRKVKAGLAPVDGPAWKHISAEGEGWERVGGPLAAEGSTAHRSAGEAARSTRGEPPKTSPESSLTRLSKLGEASVSPSSLAAVGPSFEARKLQVCQQV